MKTSLSEKRAWPFFLMCILIAFYLIFIVQLSFTRLWPLWMSLAAGAILSVFLIRISRITENAGFSLPAMPAPFRFRIFAAFFLASSAIRLLYLLAYFPGGASSDTLIQWQQIRLSQFDDWHPALHTLYEWAVTRIIPHPGALLILQDLFFSLSVAYSCSVLWRWQLPDQHAAENGCIPSETSWHFPSFCVFVPFCGITAWPPPSPSSSGC